MTKKNKIQYPQDNKQRDKNNEYNKMNNLMIVFNYMKSILKMIILFRNMAMRLNKFVSMRVKIIPIIQSIINLSNTTEINMESINLNKIKQ